MDDNAMFSRLLTTSLVLPFFLCTCSDTPLTPKAEPGPIPR